MFSPAALLVYGQVIFMGSIGLCHWLQPGTVRRGVPLSQFGVLRASRLAFMVGLVVSALCLVGASVRLLDTMPHVNGLQFVLGLSALCMIGIVVAPYATHHLSLYLLHVLFAWVGFATQVIAGFWLATLTDNWLNWLLYGLILMGGTLALLSIKNLKILTSFALGQILIINAFMLLLVRTITMS